MVLLIFTNLMIVYRMIFGALAAAMPGDAERPAERPFGAYPVGAL
jgi:hypothetical protein